MNLPGNMHRFLSLALLSVVIGFGSGLRAQSKGTPKVFTLDECLRIASEKNFGVRSALGQYDAQNASLVQAFGTFLPSFNASMGFTRQLNVEGGRTVNIGGQIITLPGVQPNSYSMNAIASYNLFNGFSRESNYRRAQRNLDAAELNLRRTRQTVSYQVRSQYLGVLRSLQVRKLRAENLELGRQELERSKAQLESGRIAVALVYSQEADLGSREFDVVSSENAENQSKAQLLSTLALPPNMQAEFAESSFDLMLAPTAAADFRRDIGDVVTAMETALRNRPDYNASVSTVAAADAGITAARGNYFPNLNASGGWSWTNSTFDQFSQNGRYFVGMNMNVPIFDNFNAATQTQLADIEFRQRDIEREQAEQRVRTDVQSALLNLDAAEKQLEITNRSVRSATQNYEAMRERLNVGASTPVEFQMANTLLVTAKINRINAVYNYYDAQEQVRLALGTLGDK